MKIWLRGVLVLSAGALGAATLGLWLASSDAPAVGQHLDVRFTDVERVLQIARAHDPRKTRPGRVTAVAVNERDLDLLLNHAAHRRLGARLDVRLTAGVARVQASVELPGNPFGGWFGRWFNLEARWIETDALPLLDALRVGRLPLPLWLAEPLLHAAAARLGAAADLQLVAEVVQRVQFMPGQMSVVYVWHHDTSARVLAVLTPPEEQRRLRAYSDRLVELAARSGPAWTVPLPQLVGPLFELARQRSGSGDAAAENRAAILTLALFSTGRGLGAVVPAARRWPQPHWLQVTLQGRDDSPQHFMVSAALAIEGSSPLANAIGLAKEVADSRGGSGFSFNDMAANRAGTRFGELALHEPARLQALLAAGVNESSLMPDVADLPEFLSQAEFTRQFGGVGAPGYLRMLADIERRVAALPLYR